MNWKQHPVVSHSAVAIISCTALLGILIQIHNLVVQSKDATIERLRTDLQSAREQTLPDPESLVWKEGEIGGTNSVYFEIGTNKFHFRIPEGMGSGGAK